MLRLIFNTFFIKLLLCFSLIGQISFADDKIQIKQYETGGIYEGEFLNGKQHGKGKYSLPNGYTYEGEWKDGKIEGMGKSKYPDGSLYEGNFLDGQHSGQGKLIFPDGTFYEGNWL